MTSNMAPRVRDLRSFTKLPMKLTYSIYVHTIHITWDVCHFCLSTMCMYKVTCSKFYDLLFPQLLDENAHLIRVRCSIYHHGNIVCGIHVLTSW